MSDKPHLIWHSNAPWASTGYGQQTALFAPRLKERFDVAISAFYGLEANVVPWNGLPVLPGRNDFGDQMIGAHAKTFFGSKRGGIVLTLCDVWGLDHRVWRDFDLCCWCPVDHEPAPPLVRQFFEQTGAVPIAMSRFGQQQLSDLGALYVPHGCDTDAYKPVENARQSTKLPKQAFVVGMVAANKDVPSRKCFPQALMAFKAFHDRHDDAVLYLHSAIQSHQSGVDTQSVDLAYLAKAIGIPTDAVIFANQDRILRYPFNAEQMAGIYSALDVLLLPSAGEGFGLPVLEANACGVPAIVTDFSAQPEVLGAGWKVKHKPLWTAQRSWRADPDVEDITEALNACYAMSDAGRKKMAEKARAHALTYNADRVLTEHFLPALEEVQRRFDARKPKAVGRKLKVAA